MTNIPRLLQRAFAGCRFGPALISGLAMVAAGVSGPGGESSVAAQAPSPCALLTIDDIQPIALNESITDGVSNVFEAYGFSACRYTWGAGTGRFRLDVTLSEGSRMFAGMGLDLIRQQLQASVIAGTADAIIPDVGEAAVFKADSSVYVRSVAYLKGRVLQVDLDGLDARDKKDQVIALLKSAASRL